jgi:hypothetical protein
MFKVAAVEAPGWAVEPLDRVPDQIRAGRPDLRANCFLYHTKAVMSRER